MQTCVCTLKYHSKLVTSRIGGVMVSVIASSVVVRVFEPRSGQTKDYAVSICCFSTQHAVFKTTDLSQVTDKLYYIMLYASP
jgi:hypothetical protein